MKITRSEIYWLVIKGFFFFQLYGKIESFRLAEHLSLERLSELLTLLSERKDSDGFQLSTRLLGRWVTAKHLRFEYSWWIQLVSDERIAPHILRLLHIMYVRELIPSKSLYLGVVLGCIYPPCSDSLRYWRDWIQKNNRSDRIVLLEKINCLEGDQKQTMLASMYLHSVSIHRIDCVTDVVNFCNEKDSILTLENAWKEHFLNISDQRLLAGSAEFFQEIFLSIFYTPSESIQLFGIEEIQKLLKKSILVPVVPQMYRGIALAYGVLTVTTAWSQHFKEIDRFMRMTDDILIFFRDSDPDILRYAQESMSHDLFEIGGANDPNPILESMSLVSDNSK